MRQFWAKFKWPVILSLAVALLAAYTGVTVMPYGSNQILARGDVVAQVGNGTYSWKTNPGWGSTDGTAINYTDLTTYVNTSGCVAPGTGVHTLVSKAYADGCKYTASAKTALSNSFGSGCPSWTFAGVTGTGLVAVAPVCGSSGDFDADTGFSSFTTTNSCGASGTCEGSNTYTFSISAPAGVSAESISFDYKGSVPAVTGDTTNCGSAAGFVGLTLTVNGTSITLPGIVANGVWSSSGSVSLGAALVNGSNTLTFTQSGVPTADSSYSNSICHNVVYAQSSLNIDAITITATY